MALNKTVSNDKIEVIGQYKHVHVRQATAIDEDGTLLSTSFHRSVYTPGDIDGSDNFVDTDISGLDSDVQAICNAAWTQSVKDAYKAHLIANKPGG